MRRSGGRIARVAERDAPDQIVEDIAAKDLRNEPHPFMSAELFSVRSHDAGAFLPAVLQRVEAVVREFGGIGMPINTENTAIMFGILLHFTRSTGAHYSTKAPEHPACPRNILPLKKPPEKG